jgi:hypothetical protein
MAIKTFTDLTTLPASDINTYLANSGLVFVAAGTVTLSTTPTQITGVFNSTYRNYRLILNSSGRSATNRYDMRYLVGTTQITASYYQGGIGSEYATNAVVYMQRSNNDSTFFGQSGGTSYEQNSVIDIIAPNLAAPTLHTGQLSNRETGLAYSFGGVNTTSNAFTGFQLSTNTGTITMKYQVMGYRDA